MELCSLVKLELPVGHLEDGGEGRGEERKAVFWLVREVLSARLLWEKLGYDARHVAEGQERDVQRSTVKSPWTRVLYWLSTVLHKNHIARTI